MNEDNGNQNNENIVEDNVSSNENDKESGPADNLLGSSWNGPRNSASVSRAAFAGSQIDKRPQFQPEVPQEEQPWWHSLDKEHHKEAQRYKSLGDMMKAHNELRASVTRKWADFKKNDYELYKQQIDSFEGVPQKIEEYKLDISPKKYQGRRGEYELSNHFTDENLDILKQVGFVAGLNNEQMQTVYEAMNHLFARESHERDSQQQQMLNRLEKEVFEGWGAQDPKGAQAALHQLDVFFNSGLAQQLSGYKVEQIQAAMREPIPAIFNPVILNLIKGVAGLMSNSASAGVNSEYVSQEVAEERFQAFVKDKDKMAIRLSHNHPRKEEMKKEYRELWRAARAR